MNHSSSCDEGAGCGETGAFPCAFLTFTASSLSHLSGWNSMAIKRFVTKTPTGSWNKTAPWNLHSRIPPWDRAFRGWRSRKRRGTSRRGTQRCRRSAPELTGQFGEFTHSFLPLFNNTATHFNPSLCISVVNPQWWSSIRGKTILHRKTSMFGLIWRHVVVEVGTLVGEHDLTYEHVG